MDVRALLPLVPDAFLLRDFLLASMEPRHQPCPVRRADKFRSSNPARTTGPGHRGAVGLSEKLGAPSALGKKNLHLRGRPRCRERKHRRRTAPPVGKPSCPYPAGDRCALIARVSVPRPLPLARLSVARPLPFACDNPVTEQCVGAPGCRCTRTSKRQNGTTRGNARPGVSAMLSRCQLVTTLSRRNSRPSPRG